MYSIYNILTSTIYLFRSVNNAIVTINTKNNTVSNLIPNNIPISTSPIIISSGTQFSYSILTNYTVYAYDYNSNLIYIFCRLAGANTCSIFNSSTSLYETLYFTYNIITNTLQSYYFSTSVQFTGAIFAQYANNNKIYLFERYGSNHIITINTNDNTYLLSTSTFNSKSYNAIYDPINNYFWCLPNSTNYFTVINVNNNTKRFVSIMKVTTLTTLTISTGFFYNNCIYLVPYQTGKIYYFSVLNSNTAELSSIIINEVSNISFQTNISKAIMLNTNMVYILSRMMDTTPSSIISLFNPTSNTDNSYGCPNLCTNIFNLAALKFNQSIFNIQFDGGIAAIDANDNIVIYSISFVGQSVLTQNMVYYFNPITINKGIYANYSTLHPNNNYYRNNW